MRAKKEAARGVSMWPYSTVPGPTHAAQCWTVQIVFAVCSPLRPALMLRPNTAAELATYDAGQPARRL